MLQEASCRHLHDQLHYSLMFFYSFTGYVSTDAWLELHSIGIKYLSHSSLSLKKQEGVKLCCINWINCRPHYLNKKKWMEQWRCTAGWDGKGQRGCGVFWCTYCTIFISKQNTHWVLRKYSDRVSKCHYQPDQKYFLRFVHFFLSEHVFFVIKIWK